MFKNSQLLDNMEHTIDAPNHFVKGGRWLDEIELKDLLLTFIRN